MVSVLVLGFSSEAETCHPILPAHPGLPGSEDEQEGAGQLLQVLLPSVSAEEPCEGVGPPASPGFPGPVRVLSGP